MEQLAFYLEIDTDKVLGNGVLWHTFRKIKATADSLEFVCVEPNVWEYQGDKDEMIVAVKFVRQLEDLGVIDKLEYLLVHFEDGTIGDVLEVVRTPYEKAKKAGWIEPD